MYRVILHSDCNSFFASVEMALNPKLKNVPMAVCGDPEKRHGIILAKNELAKKYRVETAETIWKAQRKCPNLVLVKPHYDEYYKYSKRVNDIYKKYTDLVEPFGIDESWLDVTSSQKLFGNGIEIANKIRNEIKETIGITVSIGVSFNKVFAKLGSDYKKPDAITVISKENYKKIVYPLKASELLYCGKRSSKILRDAKIFTIGDLASSNREYLENKLGKMGSTLYEYANGKDNSKVESIYDKHELSSISHDITFERNLIGTSEIKFGISIIAEYVGLRIRKMNKKAFTVHVAIKDKNLKVTSKQVTLKEPINLTKDIIDTCMNLVISFWNVKNDVRMLSISLSNLVEENYTLNKQISFFDKVDRKCNKSSEKQRKLENAIDTIRDSFGMGSIVKANILENNLYKLEELKKK